MLPESSLKMLISFYSLHQVLNNLNKGSLRAEQEANKMIMMTRNARANAVMKKRVSINLARRATLTKILKVPKKINLKKNNFLLPQQETLLKKLKKMEERNLCKTLIRNQTKRLRLITRNKLINYSKVSK